MVQKSSEKLNTKLNSISKQLEEKKEVLKMLQIKYEKDISISNKKIKQLESQKDRLANTLEEHKRKTLKEKTQYQSSHLLKEQVALEKQKDELLAKAARQLQNQTETLKAENKKKVIFIFIFIFEHI